MINLCKYAKVVIDESLLDDIDDQLEAGDKMVDLERANKWGEASRRKIWVAKQKKGYALFGDFVINDIDEKKYTGIPIKRITGSISISGCEIESLEGIFLDDCEIDGSLTIEDCPNLISLEGGPRSCKNLTISGCKKLKNLHCKTVVSGNLFISGNGKKFKEEDIRKDDNNIYVIRKIFCSELGNDANLNESEYLYEAFAAPQLRILADALNSMKADDEDKLDMRRFMADVQLDKIKSSQVHVYDCYDPWALKDAKLMIQGKRSGFMFTIDVHGEVDYIYRGHRVFRVSGRYGKINRWTDAYDTQVKEIERLILNSETLVIVDVNGMEATWRLHIEREENRKGATAMMRGYERTGKKTGSLWTDMGNEIDAKQIRYYQEVADANRRRYKELATKLRAERLAASGNFEKYKVKIDKLFDRYTALLSKVMKDLSKYSAYDIEFLNDKFKGANLRGKGRYQYISEDGLLVCIEKYFALIISAKTRGSSSSNGIESDLRKLESNMDAAIAVVDQKLSYLEAK